MYIAAAIAFALTLVTTPLARRALLRRGMIDTPNERSSHNAPTPRGGGVAVAIGVLTGALAVRMLSGDFPAAALVAASACGVVGLIEDVWGIAALRRLPLLFLAAAAGLPWVLSGLDHEWVWRAAVIIGVVVWTVSYVNAFNFMDGINGIAVGQAIVAGGAWFVVGAMRDFPGLAAAGLVLAAAALGFAPHNFPTAKLFLGDVGSYFLGGFIALIAVFGLRAGLAPEAILAPLLIFIVDTGMTLARRLHRGERWFEAHRQHTYQRLTMALNESHVRAMATVFSAMVACACLGFVSLTGSIDARVLADVGIALVLAGYLAAPAVLARIQQREAAHV